MVNSVTREVQTTVGAYLREIPAALGQMDYEVVGDRVVAFKGRKMVVIRLTYEDVRHLDFLDMPMTKVDITCIGFANNEAKNFFEDYDRNMRRVGGM